jgi:isopentenyl-diphosphate Delta-isomerase
VVLLAAQRTGSVHEHARVREDARQNASRKADHLRINLEEDVRSRAPAGFDAYRLEHVALPELALTDVNTSTDLFGRQLAAPFIVSSMTGGVAEAVPVITNLAIAAQECGVALGIGSQRAAVEQPELDCFYLRSGALPARRRDDRRGRAHPPPEPASGGAAA